MHYNEQLAADRNVSDENRLKLDYTYKELFYAFDNPEEFESVEKTVQALEFELQGLWGFPQDAKFHRYQQHISGCSCPVFDNMELFGHDVNRYRVSDCPWHWSESDAQRTSRPWDKEKV